jgi:hypothetical protein
MNRLVGCAGYTFHLLHIQPRPTFLLDDTGAAAFAFEQATEKEMVSACRVILLTSSSKQQWSRVFPD